MQPLRPLLLACLVLGAGPEAHATRITLYDPDLDTLPTQQGWLGYQSLNGSTPTRHSGGTMLDSGGDGASPSNDGEAGWSNWTWALFWSPINAAFPTLDPTTGFVLGFELRIHSEVHANANRAGFSVTLLDADTRGIELGFWSDRVWAQRFDSDPLFQQGTGVGWDTTLTAWYELAILGDQYRLSAEGNALLSGATGDYGDYLTGILNLADPYEVPSFIFLGDNSDSARATFSIGRITLSTNAVPLPAPITLFLAVLGPSVWIGRHRRRSIAERRHVADAHPRRPDRVEPAALPVNA